MTKTVSDTDIAALQAARSIIADAAGHPAQKAAIEAIDRLGETAPTSLIDFISLAWPTLYPDKPFERTPVVEHICRMIERYGADAEAARRVTVSEAFGNPVRRRAPESRLIIDDPHDGSNLLPDWYDGNPKRCPGSGTVPRQRYIGEMTAAGSRIFVQECAWCSIALTDHPTGTQIPEHTFTPVRVEDWTYAEGRVVQTFAGLASTGIVEIPPRHAGTFSARQAMEAWVSGPTREECMRKFDEAYTAGGGYTIADVSDARASSLKPGLLGGFDPPKYLWDGIVYRIRVLYGLDALNIERDEQRKLCKISATRIGASYSVTVIDQDVIESPLPLSPWFAAFRELALRAGVEDVASKDAVLAELLSPGAF